MICLFGLVQQNGNSQKAIWLSRFLASIIIVNVLVYVTGYVFWLICLFASFSLTVVVVVVWSELIQSFANSLVANSFLSLRLYRL